MKLNIYIIIGILFLINQNTFGQQDPEYTHYMYNMSLVNPAYSISEKGVLEAGLFYRNQWAGIKGGPKTTSFFSHYVLNEKMEIGLNLVNDNIGEGTINENNFSLDYSYNVNLTKRSKLSFGIKAGFTLFDTNFNNFNLESGSIETDPLFLENTKSFFPNIGAGLFYFGEKHYIGLSVPNLLNNKHLKEENGVYTAGIEELHFYFTGGYVFNLDDDYKLKPSFLFKEALNSNFSLDTSLNLLIFNRFELGVSHRLNDSFSGLIKLEVLKDLHIGYSYDKTISNLGEYNSGTHEIMILFRLGTPHKNYKSPRFF